jgi:hypothetical protein
MTPGWETAAGFFVGPVRALTLWKNGSCAALSLANRGVSLFFIVIFYRCLHGAIEVDGARPHPQVAERS